MKSLGALLGHVLLPYLCLPNIDNTIYHLFLTLYKRIASSVRVLLYCHSSSPVIILALHAAPGIMHDPSMNATFL